MMLGKKCSMSQNTSDTLGHCKFSRTRPKGRYLKALCQIGPLFVFACLLFTVTPVWAQELTAIEERILRMEQEMQLLKQRNEQLERKLNMLRERIGIEEGVSRYTAEEEITELKRRVEHPDSQKKVGESNVRLNAGYKRGFNIASGDGQYKLKLGGRITSRFRALDSGHPLNDEFSVERARLYSKVSLLDYYDLRIQVEFSENPTLKDGYLDVHYVPWARLRMGQFKVPFAWEYLQSHKYIDFAERSMAVDNMRSKGRDIGVMLHGRFHDDLIQYQLAILNGTGENKADDNDAKDLAGRLSIQPFRETTNEIFSDLHLGVAGAWGDQDTDFKDIAFKTVAGTKFVDFEPAAEGPLLFGLL